MGINVEKGSHQPPRSHVLFKYGIYSPLLPPSLYIGCYNVSRFWTWVSSVYSPVLNECVRRCFECSLDYYCPCEGGGTPSTWAKGRRRSDTNTLVLLLVASASSISWCCVARFLWFDARVLGRRVAECTKNLSVLCMYVCMFPRCDAARLIFMIFGWISVMYHGYMSLVETNVLALLFVSHFPGCLFWGNLRVFWWEPDGVLAFGFYIKECQSERSETGPGHVRCSGIMLCLELKNCLATPAWERMLNYPLHTLCSSGTLAFYS